MFLLRLLRRLLKALIYLIIVVILIPIVGLAYGFLTTDGTATAPLPGVTDGAPPATLAEKVRAEIPGYQRPEEATFLTYPEWAIVHAAREFARFMKEERPSDFPYLSYIGRYWQDYAVMIRASQAYPLNYENHQMLVVIGTSHTIELLLQWAYENTIGSITQATAGEKRVAADDYIAGVAADYAAFLDQVPSHEFPYAEKRAGLWALERKPGDDEVRTTERRWAFALAYSIKQGYADLSEPALAATSDSALLDIHVWVKGPIGEAVRSENDTLLERDLGDDGAIFVTKRYQAFTEMIPRLIDQGISFVEIGGNDEVLVTVLSADALAAPEGSRILFEYQVPADPTERRTGLLVAVRRLHAVVPALTKAGASLEHVYDY